MERHKLLQKRQKKLLVFSVKSRPKVINMLKYARIKVSRWIKISQTSLNLQF